MGSFNSGILSRRKRSRSRSSRNDDKIKYLGVIHNTSARGRNYITKSDGLFIFGTRLLRAQMQLRGLPRQKGTLVRPLDVVDTVLGSLAEGTLY